MPRLDISPCPNDTFAFYGLIHGKTSWQLDLEQHFADIEVLNQRCFSGEASFCKISFHAFIHLREAYCLLNAGSALGFGCGPLIVAQKKYYAADLAKLRIAIPGKYTTAFLLLQLLAGPELDVVELRFDQIMDAVAKGEVDAGLIIHESRFTYQAHGLTSVIDLGEWWERKTGKPIPLGGIVAKRELNKKVVASFDLALAESVDYAWKHKAEILPFMKDHAREMNEEVMWNHVNLYVNHFTKDLGKMGHEAIAYLADFAVERGICAKSEAPLFREDS